MAEKHYLDDVARRFIETIVKHTRKNLEAEGVNVPNISIGEITSAGKYLEVLIRKYSAKHPINFAERTEKIHLCVGSDYNQMCEDREEVLELCEKVDALKSQLAESQAEVEHLQKMLKEHQEALGDATKIYSEKKEAQLAERDKEIERLIQEIKDYMKPNPLACGEMLQCNACQGTCECDCEIRKERSK